MGNSVYQIRREQEEATLGAKRLSRKETREAVPPLGLQHDAGSKVAAQLSVSRYCVYIFINLICTNDSQTV